MLERHEKTIMGKNKSKYLAIAIFVVFMGVVGMSISNSWSALEAYGYDTWASKNHIAGFVFWAINGVFVLGFVLSFVAFKFITIIYVLRRICVELTEDKVIRVRPTNPDKAGGLEVPSRQPARARLRPGGGSRPSLSPTRKTTRGPMTSC